jgi:hypothetical protein
VPESIYPGCLNGLASLVFLHYFINRFHRRVAIESFIR